MPLKDVIARKPRLLLVGINPGLRSEATGHHFAGRGNPFWRLLFAAGLTPQLLAPEEDQRLKDFGISLTNLCARPTRTAAELTRDELQAGRHDLRDKIAVWRPAQVAFVGVSIYAVYFAKKTGGGAGAKSERIEGAPVFVLPNPSGLNASYPGFNDKLVWFEALARLCGL